MYAWHARDVLPYEFADDDQWAWIGRDFSNGHEQRSRGVNPMTEDFGTTAFGTDSKTDGAGNPVTTHSALEAHDGTGYYDIGSEALINIGRALPNAPENMSTHVEHDPSPYQQPMIGGSYF